jgi:hypothetical protein
MSDQPSATNERLEDESKPFQEEANKKSSDLHQIELNNPHSPTSLQDAENNTTNHQTQIGPQKHSRLLVSVLWILSVLCLSLYLYIDIRLIFIDHLLTRYLPPVQDRGTLYFISRTTHLSTTTFLAFSTIWTLFKAQKSKAVLYFVLFFELYVLLGIAEQLYIMEIFNSYPYFLSTLTILVLFTFLRLLLEFPLHLTKGHIVHALAHRPFGRRLVRPLSWLLKMQNSLVFFLPLFLVIAWLIPGVPFLLRSWMITAIAMIVGSAYVLIQMQCGSRKQLQPLYWWLWVLFIHFLFYMYRIVDLLLNLNLPDEIWRILFIITLLSIIICCFLTVFFTDLLDAALVLRKTFLYGCLLLILLTFFGSLEHYLFHHLAHWLHLKDTIITSIFAAITGMLFHPLKEKLSHWIKHFEERQKVHAQP